MTVLKQLMISSLILAMLATPLCAMNYDDGIQEDDSKLYHYQTDPAAMFVDVVAARPLGLASIAGGTATFIVSLPFSLLGGNTKPAFGRLVVDPCKYTFARPLGNF